MKKWIKDLKCGVCKVVMDRVKMNIDTYVYKCKNEECVTFDDSEAIRELEAERFTDTIYELYGSSSGHLFGIPPELKHAVHAIVKLVIARVKDEN